MGKVASLWAAESIQNTLRHYCNSLVTKLLALLHYQTLSLSKDDWHAGFHLCVALPDKLCKVKKEKERGERKETLPRMTVFSFCLIILHSYLKLLLLFLWFSLPSNTVTAFLTLSLLNFALQHLYETLHICKTVSCLSQRARRLCPKIRETKEMEMETEGALRGRHRLCTAVCYPKRHCCS